MPKNQVLIRTAAGLYSQHNAINLAPEGALLEADNVVIEREGVVGLRRGFERTGTQLAAQPTAIGEFADSLLTLVGETIYRDSGATAWAGSFLPPDSQTRLRFLQVREAVYFSTSQGIYKNDALASAPTLAGMPDGLDSQLSFYGIGDGWMQPGTQVGYRVAWTREDANEFLVVGTPSLRESISNPTYAVTLDWAGGIIIADQTAHGYSTGDTIVISGVSATGWNGSYTITVLDANTWTVTQVATPTGSLSNVLGQAGKTFNVQLTTTVPATVRAGDKLEVYRTEMSASASTDPGDRHFKVLEIVVTAAHLSAGTVTFQDDYDESFLGLDLYTNPNQETTSQTNDRPPWCADFTVWKGYPWFLNTRQEHQVEIQLLDAAGLTSGTFPTISINGLTYSPGTSESIASRQFQGFSSGSSAENIRNTAKSLVRVINRHTGNTDIDAFYVSGIDDAPGKMLFRRRTTVSTAFSVSATAGTVEPSPRWSPDLVTAAETSKNDHMPNRLHRGKLDQMEAVPRLEGSKDLGSERFRGLRVLPLRDSLIVLKEDGVWRVSGESDTSFVYKLLDPSTRILCPESAVVLDNSVYCLSNQGVVRISESGTAIVSRPIEADLKRLFSLPDYKTTTFAAAHESERKYYLFAKENSFDLTPTIVWVYDYLTEAWTRWRKPSTVAHVMFTEDRLHIAHPTDLWILRERKSFNSSLDDFADEAIPTTITAVGSVVIDGETFTTIDVAWTYSKAISRGFLAKQESHRAGVQSVASLGGSSYRLTLTENDPGFAAGACDLILPIEARIRWKPEAASSPGVSKQFTSIQLYMDDDDAAYHTLGFSSDVVGEEEQNEIILDALVGWGREAWGDAAWGDARSEKSTAIKAMVPRDRQRCRALSVSYEHCFAQERFQILNLAFTYSMTSDRTIRTPN